MRVKDIFESFDSQYTVIRRGNKNAFITEDGESFYVEFEGNNPVEVNFYTITIPNIKTDLNQNPNAFETQRGIKVLTTVSGIISQYLQQSHPDSLEFECKGEIGELFEKVMSRQSHTYRGYSIQMQRNGRSFTFTFTNA